MGCGSALPFPQTAGFGPEDAGVEGLLRVPCSRAGPRHATLQECFSPSMRLPPKATEHIFRFFNASALKKFLFNFLDCLEIMEMRDVRHSARVREHWEINRP